LSIKCRQYAFVLKSVLGISIKENDTPIRIAQKILRQCLGLSFQAPVKRGAKGNQQRCYPSVEITPLRQSILEAWYLRDSAALEAKSATQKALNSLRTPKADSPAAESLELGGQGRSDAGRGGRGEGFPSGIETPRPVVGLKTHFSPRVTASPRHRVIFGEPLGQSLDSDIEVGTRGNITTIPVVPTESGAYQDAANVTELEQLVDALPFCETVEDLVNVIEGCAIEVVEDAIAMQDTQPRRQRLTEWLAFVKTEPKPIQPILPSFKVGDALERLNGVYKGKVAQVLQVFQDWLETSLGAVTLDEIKSGSWRIIGST
jgi:hypothetical protein